jgi:hypothetical protein
MVVSEDVLLLGLKGLLRSVPLLEHAFDLLLLLKLFCLLAFVHVTSPTCTNVYPARQARVKLFPFSSASSDLSGGVVPSAISFIDRSAFIYSA